jgi:N-acetyl-anhydromuramyl-L-alanine amidase AmpD
MEIDRVKYKLPTSNHIPIETKKNRIVIGNTYSTDMGHITSWKQRLNGNFKRTANFTINLKGDIYQHFSPKYYSEFLDNEALDSTTISIVLENEGWLERDLIVKNRFVNYIGHIYKRDDEVLNKRWRNITFWAPYTKEQEKSLTELTKDLCKKYGIIPSVISHNTNFAQVEDYRGVLYRSNFNKYYTDVNPTWGFLEFKNNVEEKKTND